MLYHGSPRLLSVLDPRREHGDPDVPDAVFASRIQIFATTYCVSWTDRDIGQSVWYGKDDDFESMELHEMRPGVFEERFVGQAGYLYHLSDETFRAQPGRSARMELLSFEPVVPVRVEEIEDVWAHLQADGRVKMFPYDGESYVIRRCIERQVDRAQRMTSEDRAQYLRWRLEGVPPEINQLFAELL